MEERPYPHFYDYSMKIYQQYEEYLEDEITKLTREMRESVAECRHQIEAGKMRPHHLRELKYDIFSRIKWLERQQTFVDVQRQHMLNRGKARYDKADLINSFWIY